MRSKLLPAEIVRKKSLECAVNITKKKRQRELDAIIKWIEEASEEGYTERGPGFCFHMKPALSLPLIE